MHVEVMEVHDRLMIAECCLSDRLLLWASVRVLYQEIDR